MLAACNLFPPRSVSEELSTDLITLPVKLTAKLNLILDGKMSIFEVTPLIQIYLGSKMSLSTSKCLDWWRRVFFQFSRSYIITKFRASLFEGWCSYFLQKWQFSFHYLQNAKTAWRESHQREAVWVKMVDLATHARKTVETNHPNKKRHFGRHKTTYYCKKFSRLE